MFSVLGIIMTALTITLIEVPHLIRDKLKGELWAFFSLLGMGMTLSFVIALDVEVPSPLEAITILYKPLGDLIFRLLEG